METFMSSTAPLPVVEAAAGVPVGEVPAVAAAEGVPAPAAGGVAAEGPKEQHVSTGGQDDNVNLHSESARSDKKRPCPTTDNNNNNNDDHDKKKAKTKPDAYKIAYQNVTFVPIPSTGRPGTPHSFFQESYTVHWNNTSNNKDDDMSDENNVMHTQPPQVVHKHVNGLVIVTAGSRFMNAETETETTAATETTTSNMIESVNYLVTEGPTVNANERRKIQAKMLRNKKNVTGVVEPSSILCRAVTSAAAATAAVTAATAALSSDVVSDNGNNVKMETETNETQDPVQPQLPSPTTDDAAAVTDNVGIPLYSCVWGSIMEINPKLLLPADKGQNSNLLATDPLLDGYLAAILPTGPFPPAQQNNDKQQELEKEINDETSQ
jgi:hypothetical protein